MATANNYDDSSIDLQIGASRIRKRPASMLGSEKLEGARHGFTEIYGNALDERSAGYGDRLDVTYGADASISVRDYGRGVPLGWNDKKEVKNWNWHVIYNELYGGGKYDNNQEALRQVKDWSKFDERDYNYLFSVGLNGLGAASTQYTSEFFEVRSYKDGVLKSRSFSKGMPLVNGVPYDMFTATKEEIVAIPEEISETSEPNGTFVHWKPDNEVFTEVEVGGDWLLSNCEDIANIAGIELHFKDEQTGKELVIPAGDMKVLAIKHCGESAIIKDEEGNPAMLSAENFVHGNTIVEGNDFIYVSKCEIVIVPLTDRQKVVNNACYHNSVKMISGVQYEAVDNAIASFFQEKAKQRGIKVMDVDYRDSFAVFVKSYSNHASFRNATKDAVDDAFIYNMIYDAMAEKLSIEHAKGNRVICDIVERVINKAQDRLAVQQAMVVQREMRKIKREKEPEKFTSCEAYEKKDYKNAELWITEGDSAKGAVKGARDKRFQAIYPIRGKGLNVLKTNIKRIMANKEIREIFALIGTGIDLNIKGEKTFNIDDLKFDKIIFATDADEDGYQIRVLLFLIFYKLAPDLIREGHIYIAETPRFRIEMKDGTVIYALNDEERDIVLNENAGRVAHTQRYKGLGETNADVLRESTVHPDTRHLIQLTCDFENETERELIDALFGVDKYRQRKDILTSVLGIQVADMFDDTAMLLESEEVDEEDEEYEEYEEEVLS